MKNTGMMLAAAVLAALFAGCAGCAGVDKPASLMIMTWNAQWLGGGAGDGEAALAPPEKYRGRLNAIAAAIGGLERTPDIIAVQEVESPAAARDLAAALWKHGFCWTYFARVPGAALGAAVVSRLPFVEAKAHSASIDGQTAPRPVLEVRVAMPAAAAGGEGREGRGGSPLLLFVCHWKSKRNGEAATENARKASARVVLRRLRETARDEPGLPVVVMGDLNESAGDFFLSGAKAVNALMPDDARAAELAGLAGIDADSPTAAALIAERQKDFIVVSGGKPPEARFFPAGVVVLHSPWFAELQDGGGAPAGSYFYRKKWEAIDHFLLSAPLFDGVGWDYEAARLLNFPPFTNAKGVPAAYNPKTGAGLSDHLPLLLVLKMGDG